MNTGIDHINLLTTTKADPQSGERTKFPYSSRSHTTINAAPLKLHNCATGTVYFQLQLSLLLET